MKIEKLDMESLKNQFLKSIGGQSHVLCSVHKLPLIPSFERSSKCSECDRKEYFTCCDITCTSHLCRRCFEMKDTRNINYVYPYDIDDRDEDYVEENDEDDNSYFYEDFEESIFSEDSVDVRCNKYGK